MPCRRAALDESTQPPDVRSRLHGVARCTVERLKGDMGLQGCRRGRVFIGVLRDPQLAVGNE